MMKKYIKLLSIFVLILFPNVVLADEHNHILSIEKFDVKGSEITISGYSFVSHVDNYVNISDSPLEYDDVKYNGSSNLETYLVIYKGAWDNSYINCGNNNTNCHKVVVKNKPRDMFNSRCTDEGCIKKKENIVKRNKKGLLIDGTCNDGDVNECLYFNVGFEATIDFETEALKRFTDNVKIKVVSRIKDKNGKVVQKLQFSSGFNIHKNVCTVNNAPCGSNNIKTGNYEYEFSEFANTVVYDAGLSLPIFSEKKTYIYFKNKPGKVEYKIVDFKKASEAQSIDKWINDRKVYVGDYKDNLIQLDTDVIDCLDNSETCYASYEDKNGKRIYYGDIIVPDKDNNGTVDYWTRIGHVHFEGELMIEKVNTDVVELNCENIRNFTSTNNSIDVDCGETKSLNQCSRTAVSSTDANNGYIYVLSKNQTDNCPTGRKKIDGKWYDKVKVSTYLLFNQEGKFTFGNIDPGEVYAGKGFTLGSTLYNNKITWMVGNVYANSGKPAYNYSTNAEIYSGKCMKQENFNINDYNKYYYYDNNEQFVEENNLNKISFEVIEKEAEKYVEIGNVDKIKFKSYDSNDASSKELVDVFGKWQCVNTSNSDFMSNNFDIINKNIPKVYGETFGKTITNNCEYDLVESAIVVLGDDAAKAKYAEEAKALIDENKAVNVGKKYFIEFNWNADFAWPFNLDKDINPSFINGMGMNWQLNGTCAVKVKDSFYTWDEGDGKGRKKSSLSYRSISLSKPFPKYNGDYNKIAINWRNWYKESLNPGSRNYGRLEKTHSRGRKYLIRLSKFKVDNAIELSEINSLDIGDYNKLNEYGLDGSSSFVNDFFDKERGRDFIKSGKTSYCKLGYFYADCDNFEDYLR